MDVVVRTSYESMIEERDGNYIGAQWLDALDEIFGEYAERIDYNTLVIHAPTNNTLALEMLDDLIYKGSSRFLEVSY